MREPVRLVIWDMDETFWKGTLSEGPVELPAKNRDLVVELARRGIMSAICSKNDQQRVKEVLSGEGLWDYFVLPSINWEPKGPRIHDIVQSIQLRPETVLFIDDNPSNLQEALHFTPGLQVSDLTIISSMLNDPLFVGKEDDQLTRLAQYKAIERRLEEKANSLSDVETFLRDSDIRVEIIYEISDKLDRVVELINRTNQLNFTKRRLPDNPSDARSELNKLLSSHDVQAGLIHAMDKYGDHGLVGFYMVKNDTELLHFCFSCRVLGMGVETWLYRKLGRPRLYVSNDSLTDPVKDTRKIDWITLTDLKQSTSTPQNLGHRFDWVSARGGCDLQALSHYFKVSSPIVTGEFNVGRNGFDARTDHSMFLRYSLKGLPPEAVLESLKIGYRAEDFRTDIINHPEGRGLVILSFWADVSYALYRHKRLGHMLPFALSGQSNHSLDARALEARDLPENMRQGWMASALQTLKNEYDFVGIIDEQMFKDTLNLVLDSLPETTPVVILQGNTKLRDAHQGVTHTSADNIRVNSWISQIAIPRKNLFVIDIREVIASEDEVHDWSHFDRIVYYRLFKRISTEIT